MLSRILSMWCISLSAISTRAKPSILRRDSQPNMPYDLATTKYCTYWYDNYQGASCAQIASEWVTTPADLARWNPSLTTACGNWLDGFSYCVEAFGEPLSSARSSSTTTSQPTTTTTKPAITSTPTWSVVGCYNNYTPPTLAHSVTIPGGNALMTIQACQKTCWSGGWKFAGVELKTQCYCGNEIANEIATDGNCKMTCGGDATQLCGGQNRVFVYRGVLASATTSVRPSTTSTKMASTTAALTSKETWKALGCYHDFSNFRSLRNRSSTPEESKMTVKGCQASCLTSGFSHAGVEFGKECFCDNSVRNTASNDGLCSMPCTGNVTQICGGPDHINVYKHAILTTQWINVGCYVDAGTGNRTLRNFVIVFGGDPAMSVTLCQKECGNRGYFYSGAERGVECWCDSDIQGAGVLAPEGAAGCATPCRGNATQVCGGVKRMSVSYRVPL